LPHHAVLAIVELDGGTKVTHLRMIEKFAASPHGLGPDVVVLFEDLLPLSQRL
jgi:hypothetical protein